MTDSNSFDDEFAIRISDDVLMLKTDDGNVSSTTLMSALVVIKR